MNAKINPQIFSVLGVTGFSGVSSLWEILNGNCDAMRVKIHHFEIARMLVRLDHVASFHRKRESQHHVNGCETLWYGEPDTIANAIGYAQPAER